MTSTKNMTGILRNIDVKNRIILYTNCVLIFIFIVLGIILYQARKSTIDKHTETVIIGRLELLSNSISSFSLKHNDGANEILLIISGQLSNFSLQKENDSIYKNITNHDFVNQLEKFLNEKYNDILIKSVDQLFTKEHYLESGIPGLITSKGVFLVHPSEAGKDESERLFFQQIINSGKNKGVTKYRWPENRFGKWRKQYFCYCEPIDSYVITSVFENEIYKPLNNFLWMYLLSCIGILAFITVLIHWMLNPILIQFIKINSLLSDIAAGKRFDNIHLTGENAGKLKDIENSVNQLSESLKEKAEFANHLGQGDLDFEYNTGKDDILGNALIGMKQYLIKNRQDELDRKIEDDMRSWTNQGIAKFSEILRENSNLKRLSENIVIGLVEYMNANQCGLFALNSNEEGEISIDLTASYAFNRQKFLKKTIMMGEGLIGACAVEKKTIYLKEVPENYIEITSGLGHSNPKVVLIVPLKIEEEILGIIEIASFNEFQEHEISFVEKIADSIASTLSNVKINETTNKLLEQSKIQSEELASREEELRQNMEEMQATQEESRRREEDLKKEVEELKKQLTQSNITSKKIRTKSIK